MEARYAAPSRFSLSCLGLPQPWGGAGRLEFPSQGREDRRLDAYWVQGRSPPAGARGVLAEEKYMYHVYTEIRSMGSLLDDF